MEVTPEDWLAMEQIMEEENHSLLQPDTPTDHTDQPQLLLISSHAVEGTSSAATFSVIVSIGGKKGIALIDSGSTNTFIDYTFTSKLSCSIQSTTSQRVKVVGGGYLYTFAHITSTTYYIQREEFTNGFRLLQLKGHDIILGCDWIKSHSPIGLDLWDTFRSLTIQKNGS
jgi:hypothetical protein